MHNGKRPHTAGHLAAAFLTLTLVACNTEQATTVDASKEAALANVDAMSREHARDTTEPSPAAEIAPLRPVVSQSMAYTEHQDELVYGYFSAPADMFEPLPAVIMIHEWWGLNDNIRAMADRLAGEGYIVFAVDLFNGKVATSPGEARVLMTQAIEDPEAANENIRAAFNFVSSTAGCASNWSHWMVFRRWLVSEYCAVVPGGAGCERHLLRAGNRRPGAASPHWRTDFGAVRC